MKFYVSPTMTVEAIAPVDIITLSFGGDGVQGTAGEVSLASYFTSATSAAGYEDNGGF